MRKLRITSERARQPERPNAKVLLTYMREKSSKQSVVAPEQNQVVKGRL